jgi:sRNA-binding protein
VRQQLEDLLVIPVGGRQTPLDRPRTAPVRASAPALVDALRRLDQVRAIGAGRLDLSGLPSGRVKVLARYAATARAEALARMPEQRRIACRRCRS